MQLIYVFLGSDVFRAIIKILLCVVLAGSIGLERSVMNKPAGFGTHAILGVSACLVVIASEYMANFYDVDVSRIPAQVLAGIGFIGAGAIMKTGNNVKGITTAAGLFAVTCIGIAVGIGYYSAACISTLVIFLLVSYSHSISDKLGKYETIDLNIALGSSNESKKILKKIDSYFKDNHIEVISVSKEGDLMTGRKIQYVLSYNAKLVDKSEILATMIGYDELAKVEIVDD